MANTVDAKLLRQTKFPPEFSRKVDMTRVNVEVMKKWIAGKISQILGNEDDVVIELCFNLLEGARYPDVKSLQIQLTGFLDKDTPKFCKELWNLCLSAQESPQGVPKELLEAKKLELMQEKKDAEKASEGARQRAEHERQRERDIDAIRTQERDQRGPAMGRNHRPRRHNAGEDHHSRPSEHRARNRSRSPHIRHRDTEYPLERHRNGREDGGRRNNSRSPYRRSHNEYRHSHARRRSYSTDTGSQSPNSRRGKEHRDRSRSITPPSKFIKDKRWERVRRSPSPTKQQTE